MLKDPKCLYKPQNQTNSDYISNSIHFQYDYLQKIDLILENLHQDKQTLQ